MLEPVQRDALQKAITLIGSINFQGYGAICKVCGDGVPIGTESPVAPVRCTTCVFWGDRMYSDRISARNGIPNLHSIRADGQHYTIDGQDEEGPVMTVRYLDNTVVVSTRLRLQGPVPRWCGQYLPDNAIITEGNPQNLPLGITRP